MMNVLILIATAIISIGVFIVGWSFFTDPKKMVDKMYDFGKMDKNTELYHINTKPSMLISTKISGVMLMFLSVLFIYSLIALIFR